MQALRGGSSGSLRGRAVWSLVLNAGPWAWSVVLQGVTEEGWAGELERCLGGEDDVKVLEWFERQFLSTQGSLAGVAATRGTVEEYEQLSSRGVMSVLEWLLPRFWYRETRGSGTKSGVRARARHVVSRLREAFRTTRLPASWVSYSPPPNYDGHPIFPGGTGPSSATALAYWAYYLDKREDMTPEQRLWYLAMLARWNPAPAFVYASQDLETRSRLFTNPSYFPNINGNRGLNQFEAAAALWLCYERDHDESSGTKYNPLNDRIVWPMVDQLLLFTAPFTEAFDEPPTEPFTAEYESEMVIDHQRDNGNLRMLCSRYLMGEWLNSVAIQRSHKLFDIYVNRYTEHPESFVSTYLQGLMAWHTAADPDSHAPAESQSQTEYPAFDTAHPEIYQPYEVRQLMWMEEQLVHRVVQLLLDQQAFEEKAADQATVDQATVDQATVDQATVDQENADQATVDEATVDQRTVEQENGEQQAATHPRNAGAVIWRLRQQKNFKFSVSENTFRLLYCIALQETARRVATEQGYDFAWRLGCAAISLVYGLFPPQG
ncbi:hypothetical protein GNI_016560 [Gregarina niphandrodes]|uniref:Uncharacterized protein n=1 Tax=Gregarina niphandrodes TaxID=110365 RepID=A0A023BC68_GRENI|nr:hypothetical protein GNI_016560 [Gregarina niphandrodes]EZG82431.1 hypothetical protein GNI_016560 [Gregarina niphandrodes]|eukprot:XP_011129000.1 hypothetical protein GNI_016560 [Gregarina niphandrodes]